MTAPAASNSRWLYGPGPDLLLGCGLLYAPIFVLYAVLGDTLEAIVPMALTPLLMLAVSTPHYGATLLRVYERREDRRRYALFATWTTLLLAVGFVWGVESAVVGSWLITIYLTWSPWHYAAQNYGVGLMFLRRANVHVSPLAKRLYQGTFTLSFALTFLVLHGPDPLGGYAPGGISGGLHRFLPLGIPGGLRSALLAIAAVAYVVCLVGSAALLLRTARVRDLLPAAALTGTQALWFTVPYMAQHLYVLQDVPPLAGSRAGYAFVWVATGHALQYLWITSWFARRSGRARGALPFFAKALLAGAAIWTVPAYLFAPGLLGRLPFDAGLSLTIAAVVNLHHFILDGVIWKLRDGPVARILLRPEAPSDAARAANSSVASPAWVRIALRGAGIASVVLVIAGTLVSFRGFDPALERGDETAARSHLRTLRLLGRDGPAYHVRLGLAALRRGDASAAERDFQASLEVFPSAIAHAGIAEAALTRGDVAGARHAYEQALTIDPDHAASLVGLAGICLRSGDTARAAELTRRVEERAAVDASLAPGARRSIDRLSESVRQAGGGFY